MATPPEGPALERERDTAIDQPSTTTERRRRGPSLGHDRTMTPVDGVTTLSMAPKDTAKAKNLEPGAMVGEYKIEGLLGEGGMGRVYSAIHPVIGKKAAIKVLHPKMSANSEVVERFIQEARAVNQIGHPNIVDIFSFSTFPDGTHYFVMEWLKGESLHERIRRQRLSREELCHYVKDICHALEAAHEQGIVHRDLKPDNVYLQTLKGRVHIKLLDFGIAKLASTEDNRIERTRTGAMMGTPKYIAPEQARGYTVDHRVDIYSLGVMMFELVAGRPPFEADNAMDLVASHLHDTPPRLATCAADVPPQLDDLLDAMLAKEADKRPSLARVRDVLEEIRSLPPGDAAYTIPELRAPVTAHSMIGDAPANKPRVWLFAGIGIGVAVAAVATFFIVRASSSSSPEPPLVRAITIDASVPEPVKPAVEPPKQVDPPKPVVVAGKLTVKLKKGSVNGTVVVDGNPLKGPPWELELAPGRHVIVFKPNGGKDITETVTIVAGETKVIDVGFVAPKAPPIVKPKPKLDDEFIAPPAKKP